MASAQWKHDEYLWRAYHCFRGASASSTLAGNLFEEIVHRIFARDWKEVSPKPQLTPMVSNGNDPPTFSSDLSSTPPSASLLHPLFAGCPMNTTSVDFKSGNLNVTVDDNRYYKPNATNNPLFDSFTIGRDPRGDILISVFQITVSESHGESDEGYERIHQIMQCVNEPNAEIKVRYFLVCPEGGPRKWSMPARWITNNSPNNHCGDAFCLRIRVPGMSCPFTPNFGI